MKRADWYKYKPLEFYPPAVKMLSMKAQGAYHALHKCMWEGNGDQSSIEDAADVIATELRMSQDEWLQIRAELQGERKVFIEDKNNGTPLLRSQILAEKHQETVAYLEGCSKGGKATQDKRRAEVENGEV